MTETATPQYIQVDRDQLRVGMRFDYLGPKEKLDGIVRTITQLDPLEYKWGDLVVQPSRAELEDRTFWVHPDDLHVVVEPPTGSGWETTNEIVARTHDDAYEKGLRDGYRKAQQEATTAAYTREDAIVAATKALTAMQYAAAAPDLIVLAQRIERYVNGNDQQEEGQ